MQHSVALFLCDQVLLVPHHVAAFNELQHGLRLGELVSVTGPGTEQEREADRRGHTVNQNGVECNRRESSDEACRDIHAEDEQNDVTPLTAFSLESEEIGIVPVSIGLLQILGLLVERDSWVLQAAGRVFLWIYQSGLPWVNRLFNSACARARVSGGFEVRHDVPGLITVIGDLDVMQQLPGVLLRLVNLRDPVVLSEDETRVVGLSEDDLGTEGLVFDTTTSEMRPLSELLAGHAVVEVGEIEGAVVLHECL